MYSAKTANILSLKLQKLNQQQLIRAMRQVEKRRRASILAKKKEGSNEPLDFTELSHFQSIHAKSLKPRARALHLVYCFLRGIPYNRVEASLKDNTLGALEVIATHYPCSDADQLFIARSMKKLHEWVTAEIVEAAE